MELNRGDRGGHGGEKFPSIETLLIPRNGGLSQTGGAKVQDLGLGRGFEKEETVRQCPPLRNFRANGPALRWSLADSQYSLSSAT